MLSKIKDNYSKLLKSKEYKNNGFLCSIFLISDINDIDNSKWQIDFYDESSDSITSYYMSTQIEIIPESKVFKEESTKIEELKLDDVKTEFNEIYKKTSNLLEEYGDKAVKIIVILQNQKHPVWNISYFTNRFNLLNIKVDARNGKVMEKKLIPLLSFKK